MKALSVIGVCLCCLGSGQVALAQVPSPLADQRVRQAIAYAIDMDAIAASLFGGTAIPADSMIPNGFWKAEGLNPYTYDPDKARALLQAAGWVPGTDIDVVYYYDDQDTVDLMTAIQAYLSDVGIDMTIRKLEGDVTGQLNVPPTSDYQVSGVNWDMAYGARAALAMQEFYNVYQRGSTNYAPPTAERDALLGRINGTANTEELRQAFFDFERYENEMLSDIPLYYNQLIVFESDRFNRHGGEYGNEQFIYDMNLMNWTIEPSADGKSVLYINGGPQQFFEQRWLNPGGLISKILFDRLLDADGSLIPKGGQQVETYSLSEDGLTVNFVLKEGLEWHDGEPFTVDDVAWSIETALKVPSLNGVVANTFKSIVGASEYATGEAEHVSGISTDGRSITIQLATMDPNVLVTFTQFAVMPKHLMANVDPLQFQQHPFWQKPVGTGPYRIAEVQMNDYVRFVPFENYHSGRAKIEEIVALPGGETDESVARNAAAGRLDIVATRTPSNIQALTALGTMKITPVDINYTRSFRVNAFPFQPE